MLIWRPRTWGNNTERYTGIRLAEQNLYPWFLLYSLIFHCGHFLTTNNFTIICPRENQNLNIVISTSVYNTADCKIHRRRATHLTSLFITFDGIGKSCTTLSWERNSSSWYTCTIPLEIKISALTFQAFVFLVANRRDSSSIILMTVRWGKRWRVSLGCRMTANWHTYTSDPRQGALWMSRLTSRVQPYLHSMGPHGSWRASRC